MINCHYNQIDEADFFRRVVADKYDKYQRILEPICDRVEQAYEEYLDDFPALCLRPVSVFGNHELEQKKALQKCYSSDTQTFNQFVADFPDSQPDALKTLCPYCMINTPDTLDHYVGQNEFPEYAILTKNLVPCCWTCNNGKRVNWRLQGLRSYINFYDDRFLQYPFLTADLITVPGSLAPYVSYRLFQPGEITDDDYNIILSHFDALELLSQYNLKANSRLSTEIESVQFYSRIGWTDQMIIDFLMGRYQSFALKFGVNYWEAIIYRTLSENLQLILAL